MPICYYPGCGHEARTQEKLERHIADKHIDHFAPLEDKQERTSNVVIIKTEEQD